MVSCGIAYSIKCQSYKNSKKRPIIKEAMKNFARFLNTLIIALLFAGSFFTACKSKPISKAEQDPAPALVFKGVQADDPSILSLFFALETENPFWSRAKITFWQAEIDGQKAASAFNLDYPQGDFSLNSSVPLKLNMDIAALAAKGLAPKENYRLSLLVELNHSSDFASSSKLALRSYASFPGVQPPELNITAISILKAELINTRFKVTLQMNNPNPFPVELSAFVYKLYGNGRLWAEGTEKNVFLVDGKSSHSGKLFLVMNFINMERGLLDQIVRLEDVNYRFAGDVQVSTGIEYLPKFSMGFDLSGYSEVLDE
jgi:LEA14-like dessication related protein